MTASRRRLLQSVALAGLPTTATPAAEATISLDVLRNVSTAHGINLPDDRLQVLKPVLERRLPQLQALRDFTIDEKTAPTQGILD